MEECTGLSGGIVAPASGVDKADLFLAACHLPATLALPKKGLSFGDQSSHPGEPCHGVSPPSGLGSWELRRPGRSPADAAGLSH